MVLAMAAALRVYSSANSVVLAVKAVAVTATAMAKASGSNSKEMDVAHRALQHLGNAAQASTVKSLANGPWTAKYILWRVLLPPYKTKDIKEKAQ